MLTLEEAVLHPVTVTFEEDTGSKDLASRCQHKTLVSNLALVQLLAATLRIARRRALDVDVERVGGRMISASILTSFRLYSNFTSSFTSLKSRRKR